MADEKIITKALELIVSLNLASSTAHQLNQQLTKISDWDSFISQLETNGLAPLFNQQLSSHRELAASIPKAVSLQTKALVIRHQRATQVRAQAITEILPAFAAKDIEVIALKGLALAYCLYPQPSLRPMRDIDLLVPKAQASKAQQVLRDLGYAAQERNEGSMYDHHHLPIASKNIDGMMMSIEVHHNALSGDVASSISYADLTQPPIRFEIEGHAIDRLGHTDTLRHLCHHAFEPASRIKLGSLLDIISYVEHFQQEIDWQTLQQNYSFVINTLRSLHFVIPLPDNLELQLKPPTCAAPRRLGQGYLPLTHLASQGNGVKATLLAMFSAPAWWAHVFYNVAPENKLLWVKYWRHPIQVFKWIIRRYWALLRS